MPGGEPDIVRLKRSLTWRSVEDQVVGLDLDRSVYLAGNETAAVLWPDLERGTTRAALIERLASRFQLPSDQAERDVDAFLESLASHELLDRPAAGADGSSAAG